MHKKKAILSSQSRAARAMLGWSRQRLAEIADVAERTIIDFERGARHPHRRTIADIRRAFEEAGIIFIDENETGPGVILTRNREC